MKADASRGYAHDAEQDERPEAEPVAVRLLRPTMSKTELLLICQWPWGKEVPAHQVEVGEAAVYGTAYHKVMARLLEGKMLSTGHVHKLVAEYAGKLDAFELVEHVIATAPVLFDWLKSSNPWRVDLTYARRRIELPLAYNVKHKSCRVIAAPTEDAHEYEDAKPGEFAGTADFILDGMPDKYRARKNAVPHFIVGDHKTGEFCDLPQESAQLASLAVAYSAIVKYKQREVAGVIFHAPRGTRLATVYTHEYSKRELARAQKRLTVAFERIGDGSLAPGSHCTLCPAMTICPAHTSALVKLGDKSLSRMTSEKLGAQHEAAQQITRYLERWREDARAWVKANGPGVRPDGKLVDIIEKDVENLSKASVVRALGQAEGEKMIEKLRKLGCVETTTREELRAVADK